MKGYVIAKRLLECLAERLEEEERDPIEISVVLPGVSAFRVGASECSQAWVRIAGAYPSTVTGQPDARPGACGPLLGLSLEFGIMRCWTPPDEDEEPSTEELETAMAEIAADIETLKATILCCDALESEDVLMGRWTPMGPEGPDVGGYWTLEVSI